MGVIGGMSVPGVGGMSAMIADKSTNRNERMPRKPAVNKIKNSRVLMLRVILHTSLCPDTFNNHQCDPY